MWFGGHNLRDANRSIQLCIACLCDEQVPTDSARPPRMARNEPSFSAQRVDIKLHTVHIYSISLNFGDGGRALAWKAKAQQRQRVCPLRDRPRTTEAGSCCAIAIRKFEFSMRNENFSRNLMYSNPSLGTSLAPLVLHWQSRRPPKARSPSISETRNLSPVQEPHELRSRLASRPFELITSFVSFFNGHNEHPDTPPSFYWSISFAGLWLRIGVLAFALALTHSSRTIQ
jgi:hypothetical protein